MWRCGTHCLEKAVQLLGEPTVHGHFEPGEALPEHDHHVLTIRHPRNALISWIRFARGEVTEGFILSEMTERGDLVKGSKPDRFVEQYSRYLPWLSDPSVFVVKYEDLVGDGGTTLGALAAHLGVAVPADAYPNIPGLTRTYTGETTRANWTVRWTPAHDARWAQVGGDTLQTALGY